MNATGKGTLLTAGIAFMSVGGALITNQSTWVQGVVVSCFGALFIFLREWLKEA